MKDYSLEKNQKFQKTKFFKSHSVIIKNLCKLIKNTIKNLNSLINFIGQEALERTLQTYPQIFHVEYRRLLKEKLGLFSSLESDEDFLKMTLMKF